jgi:hypothetical protein
MASIAIVASLAYLVVALGPSFGIGTRLGADGPDLTAPTRRPLALRVYSGAFTSDSQRTEQARPDVVLFDDGLVVANVSPYPPHESVDYRSIQLDATQLEQARATIVAAGLSHRPAPAMDDWICYGATILQVFGADGSKVEVVAPCLLWAPGLSSPDPGRYGAGVVSVNALLTRLHELAARDGSPWAESLPSVPAAPYREG